MNERVQRLKDKLHPERYPICVEKACLIMESYRQTQGLPQIVRRAIATAHYLDNKTIFIEDDELIVGNIAGKPMGLEAGSLGPTWPEDDMEELRKGGLDISRDDEALLRSMDDYWKGQGRTLDERQGQFYDDERLWPFIQSGILCPPWTDREEGRGTGAAGVGWGLGLGLSLIIVDYAKVLNEGLNPIIQAAEQELRGLRYADADAVKKADFLKSVLIAYRAIVRIAHRFADLAAGMATAEVDSVRKKELERIAQTCRWVPGNPARTFHEAIQSFWFIWVMLASGTTPGGRFDQFMYPFYKRDKERGEISDEDVLELLECLRIKVMQLNFVGGGKLQRQKWAGMARWHNWVIGGLTPDGEDATNELSYLILEAARDCQTPHHTITVRVHEGTPETLMLKALEVVKTGIGMPAFVGDKSYVEYLVSHGVPIREARDYALAGCLDVNIPGRSRINAFGMFIAPLVFDIAMNNGVEPRTGRQLGPRTGGFASFETFDEFMGAFKEQLAYFMGLAAEEHNIILQAQRELFPDAVHSALMVDAIEVGRDALDRTLPFENGSALNVVGMINVADSMVAVKKLVFEEKRVTKKQLLAALRANWQGDGHEEIRKMCLAAPKYGNGDVYADDIAAELYQFWADTAVTFPTIWGGTTKPTGISITAHAPGGALTGATPDGRNAGDTLADGTMSPAQGCDTRGPTALLRSAMAIDQVPFQATLLNMKFHPSTLKSTEDLRKLSDLIKTYFSFGGKHVQFNVIKKETLLDAQKHPERYRDLIIRVAGYSAYFVQLTRTVQDEIIARTQHDLMS
jgi:pyruvate formate-lyase/glycerol dehydratase family glycyl radical enzyme